MNAPHNSSRRHVRCLVAAGALAVGLVAATSGGAHTAVLAGGGYEGPGPLVVGSPYALSRGHVHAQPGRSHAANGGYEGPGPLTVL